MNGRILVVDDDAAIRETFREHLSESGYDVAVAGSAEQALAHFHAFDPALVITDVRMPGLNGIELLQRLQQAAPDVACVVITAHEDMRSAVEAMKAGAREYLVKPLDLDQIDLIVARCFRERALVRRAQSLSESAAEPYALDRLVGRDARMIEIYKRIGTLATSRAPVLIRGETGTGKELIARAIHYNSERAGEPFVAVNCTALPETLLESELFGHVRGAFTGAVADRRGHFERAGAGTVFLDEIGDIGPAFQAKLLRVLQEREVLPVGGERVVRTEARVLAATQRDLRRLVAEGRFREDLWFRLCVVEIEVPPLRDRAGDIPLLARYLLERLAREAHRPQVILPDSVLRGLQAYRWPGNVRELENALSRALILARGPALAREDLGLEGDVGASASAAPADHSLAAAERAHICGVLERVHGNKRQAARLLRISRSRLDRLLEKHGLAPKQDPNGPGTGPEAPPAAGASEA
ncbi:MAG: sigma-54-dependent Fis family transcriptional regulator [Gemmatimonadetes bacterium]|nr:sigma-54-dependent Fis family transcriptional regulator [Gemmatimonadota bacterium]